MNYKESQAILEEIKKAKRILLNCHADPDPDSLGSALSLRLVLISLGKEVRVVCPTKVPENLNFLSGYKEVETEVNFSNFDTSSLDLFISLDSSSPRMVTDSKEVDTPNLPTIVIDHHPTNTLYGFINLVAEEASSVAELLAEVYEDWMVKTDNEVATCLLTGIIGDTGSFKYTNADAKTFQITSKLLEKGADKEKINLYLFQQLDKRILEITALLLNKITIDIEHELVWTALSNDEFRDYEDVYKQANVSGNYIQSIKGTDIGMVMTEKEPGNLSVSLRSRTGKYDVSKLALLLGGGGHKRAAGGDVVGKSFVEAVKYTWETAIKFIEDEKRTA